MQVRIIRPWVYLGKPDYIKYHDHEWGVPVHDDHRLFEFLTLDAAQAGLSWYKDHKLDCFRRRGIIARYSDKSSSLEKRQ
jgi:3-methyladenine DNA glycosylase Tag